LISLFSALILLEVIVSSHGALNRFLSQPWLVYMGKISYGLYLWHYPVFGAVQEQKWPLLIELFAETAFTGIAVLASYYLLERPLLRLKGRFAGMAPRS
jgi:peptidoglycan/LPS O-acetylase OafA/YrhL